MIKKIIPAFALAFFALPCFSQEIEGAQDITPVNNDVQLLYRNEAVFGGLVHSNGWGFNYRRGKHLTGYRKFLYEGEFVTMRHPKEIKTQYSDNSKGYFYGKLNVVDVLRLGIGFQNVLYSKQDRRGVEIRYITNAGLSVAFAKPVYLEILYPDPGGDPENYITSTEKYDPSNPRHTPEYIYGRAPFLKGIDQTKIYPGGYAKLGLSFEYADMDDDVKAIETGVVVDAYPVVVPIMANARNNQVILGLYINLLYGRKWF